MIGLLDSGRGGEKTLLELRAMCPGCDACLFADRENAPYGTKSREQLVRLVKNGIDVLRSSGAEKILIACCTASTVYPLLPGDYKRAVYPIIEPTARAAAGGKNIGILATNATVQSGEFVRYIKKFNESAKCTQYALPLLVEIIEGGAWDGALGKEALFTVQKMLAPIKAAGHDTLVLGCTHFPLLSKTIAELTGVKTLVSSAHEGACEILSVANTDGVGATIYL